MQITGTMTTETMVSESQEFVFPWTDSGGCRLVTVVADTTNMETVRGLIKDFSPADERSKINKKMVR